MRYHLFSTMLFPVFISLLSMLLSPGQDAFRPPYDFRHPDTVRILPARLNEISGLGAIDSLHVVAIQDEEGFAYTLRLPDARVVQKTRFAGNGDFEGVEMIGRDLYVLRSDGVLLRISEWVKGSVTGSVKPEKMRLELPAGCDAEGVSYEPDMANLLILCKERAGKKARNKRAVFAFTLQGRPVGANPAYLISPSSVSRLAGKRVRLRNLKPAAIAVHPASRNLYIVSSRHPRLIILDKDGIVIWTTALRHTQMRQPEGLAFLQDGTLVVSSEASGEKAAIFLYRMKPRERD